MSQCNEKNVGNMLSFLESPYDEEMVKLDCNDYCEQLAELAEQVANGAQLEEVLPEWQEHISYWSECREEFEALVAVLKQENQELPGLTTGA